jgi:hypothetical protein
MSDEPITRSRGGWQKPTAQPEPAESREPSHREAFVLLQYTDFEGALLYGAYSTRDLAEAAATNLGESSTEHNVIHGVVIDAAPACRTALGEYE